MCLRPKGHRNFFDARRSRDDRWRLPVAVGAFGAVSTPARARIDVKRSSAVDVGRGLRQRRDEDERAIHEPLVVVSVPLRSRKAILRRTWRARPSPTSIPASPHGRTKAGRGWCIRTPGSDLQRVAAGRGARRPHARFDRAAAQRAMRGQGREAALIAVIRGTGRDPRVRRRPLLTTSSQYKTARSSRGRQAGIGVSSRFVFLTPAFERALGRGEAPTSRRGRSPNGTAGNVRSSTIRCGRRRITNTSTTDDHVPPGAGPFPATWGTIHVAQGGRLPTASPSFLEERLKLGDAAKRPIRRSPRRVRGDRRMEIPPRAYTLFRTAAWDELRCRTIGPDHQAAARSSPKEQPRRRGRRSRAKPQTSPRHPNHDARVLKRRAGGRCARMGLHTRRRGKTRHRQRSGGTPWFAGFHAGSYSRGMGRLDDKPSPVGLSGASGRAADMDAQFMDERPLRPAGASVRSRCRTGSPS